MAATAKRMVLMAVVLVGRPTELSVASRCEVIANKMLLLEFDIKHGQGDCGILYDVSPYRPALLAAAYLVLTSTALLAARLPVRRTTSIDRVIALRHE